MNSNAFLILCRLGNCLTLVIIVFFISIDGFLAAEFYEQYTTKGGGVSSNQGWIEGWIGDWIEGFAACGYSKPNSRALATAWVRLSTPSLP